MSTVMRRVVAAFAQLMGAGIVMDAKKAKEAAGMTEARLIDDTIPRRFSYSPAEWFRHNTNCKRRRKTNRLHLSRKAKIARRRAS